MHFTVVRALLQGSKIVLQLSKQSEREFRRLSDVFSWGFFSSAEDEDKDNNTDVKESALSQLIREQLIKGDVNTEVPTLARMVKIVVASMHEGTPLCIRNLMTCLQMQGV